MTERKNIMVPNQVFAKLLHSVEEAEEPVYDNPVLPFEQYKEARRLEFEAISVRLFDRLQHACDLIKEQAAQGRGG